VDGDLIDRAGPRTVDGLEDDPAEQRPLDAHPAMADYAASLLDWRMATDDQVLADHLALPGGMVVLDA